MALGLFPRDAFRLVLGTAYIAIFAGAVTMWYVLHRHSRSLIRAAAVTMWYVLHRHSRSLIRAAYRGGRYRESWDFVFDSTGLTCKTADFESRIQWRALRGVEDTGTLVLIWLYDQQAVGLPIRLFADAAAREQFVASVAARIKAAKSAAP